MKLTTVKKVPPDGGYGWVVALAMAINGFLYVPFMHSFGLIFKDTFKEMGLSAAQGSLIVNFHAAFGMLIGLLNGVLLKMFGYRKVAFFAALTYFSGVTLVSTAKSFWQFVLYFGLIASLGVGMNRSSYSLAINTYFRKKRSKAMGMAVTIIGLGQIIVPQLANFLLKSYTPHGVILIFGGLAAHFFATSLLLHPVKWYLKEEETEETVNDEKNQQVLEEQYQDSEIYDSHLNLNDEEEEPKKDSVFKSITKFFDFDLLKDPIFVNILIGMGFAVFSELNFNVLVPFILAEYELNNDQIATFMSTTGCADIIFRLLAPFIGEYFKKPPRVMFLSTLLILIIMRFVLLFATNYYVMLAVAAGLGMARGVRRVYVGLIIPTHVSIEKLPSASGMEMMSNGLCILTGGSILGLVRDITGSYYTCIVIMNFVTFLTFVLWTVESFIVSNLKKKEIKVRENGEDHPLNKI